MPMNESNARKFDFTELYDESCEAKRKLGAIGERVVSKATDGYVEESGDEYDDGIDVVTAGGVKIDVKTTGYESGHLLVRAERKHYSNADAYALVVVPDGEESAFLIGALTADEVYSKKPRYWPDAQNHIFKQNELRALSQVVREC